MTINKALKILDVSESYTEEELKKKYRALMILTHPDSGNDHDYKYEASDINAAYEYLLNHKYDHNVNKEAVKKRTASGWNAEINMNAYCERDIYYAVEDSDGEVIGKAVIASGKYTWSLDEEFSLFLLSIYNASKKIVYNDDEESGKNRNGDIALQGEIAYLLSQQFVDTSLILSLAEDIGEDKDGLKMYSLKGMLESGGSKIEIKDGEILYPAGIKHHRLYVKNNEGIIGYVSFKDDRLYYGIIPLFERKAVKVKMRAYPAKRTGRGRTKFYDVKMDIKVLKEDRNHMIESINLKIDEILKRY